MSFDVDSRVIFTVFSYGEATRNLLLMRGESVGQVARIAGAIATSREFGGPYTTAIVMCAIHRYAFVSW
jgi:hypothetical protein